MLYKQAVYGLQRAGSNRNSLLPTKNEVLKMKYDLSIIGLGYVGLPLALQFAKSGCRVLGLDIDPGKVKEIEAGRSYIRHIPAEAVVAQVEAGKFTASSDFSLAKHSEAVLICVPTPLKKNREPDISYILKSGEAIAPYLKPEDGGRNRLRAAPA